MCTPVIPSIQKYRSLAKYPILFVSVYVITTFNMRSALRVNKLKNLTNFYVPNNIFLIADATGDALYYIWAKITRPLSCVIKTLYPLNNNSLFPHLARAWHHLYNHSL